MNGRTWILFQKTSELVKNIQQVPDLKNHPQPKYRESEILSSDCRILDPEISSLLHHFRTSLFSILTSQQSDLLFLSKQDDSDFIQNSLILLDERLKLHYPLKGQIEVEIYQRRSG